MVLKKRILTRAAAAALMLLLSAGCAFPGNAPEVEPPVSTFGAAASIQAESVQTTVPASGGADYGAEQPSPAAEAPAETEQTIADGSEQSQYTPDDPAYADAEQYPYYARLSDQEKVVYQQLVDQISAGCPNVTPCAVLTGDELNAVVSAVYREQPQLFWMENEWTWYSSAATGAVTSISMKFNELADDLDSSIAAFQSAAAEALQNLDGLSDAEKELAIHDFLASNTTYLRNDLDQSAYSALVNHSSVCCGFTRAFQYLMQCEGIPAYFCQGTANGFTGSENTGDHAWSIVKLGDGYYNVDVTWDETAMSDRGLVIYSYFNRTDEIFSADHYRDESSEFLPACTVTEFSYEALRGVPAELGVMSQMELDSSEPISSLEAYYQFMESCIIAAGTGTHTFSCIIYGDDCMAQISEAISANEIQAGFLDNAAATIGLNGYASTYSCQNIELGGGYYYVSQTIELNAN